MYGLRLRTDLERSVIDGFALPLGLVPSALAAPIQGYTIEYLQGEEDEPDTYAFYIVVSHERVGTLMDQLLLLLPREVYGIVEIGSRDAYRTTDVYMAQDAFPRDEFLRGWRRYRHFILEDGSIAAGANSEEPYVEVFLDHWKGITVTVPLLMRDQVEHLLTEEGLEEVIETWPITDDGDAEFLEIRPVLTFEDGSLPDEDELLRELRHIWRLELNVDPDSNLDEGGRELGSTLWHATLMVESMRDAEVVATVSVWATASSISEMEELIEDSLERYPAWRVLELDTIDRVAFDERPPSLEELEPRRLVTEVHLVEFEPAVHSPETVEGGGSPEGHEYG